MTVSRERYELAYTFSDYASQVSKHEGLWNGIYEPQVIPEDALQRLGKLPGRRHVLVVAEDWCGDAASLVPVLAKMVDSAPEYLDLRIVERDENLEFLTLLERGGELRE